MKFIIFSVLVLPVFASGSLCEGDSCENCLSIKNCAYIVKGGQGSCHPLSEKIEKLRFRAVKHSQCKTVQSLMGRKTSSLDNPDGKGTHPVSSTPISFYPTSSPSHSHTFTTSTQSPELPSSSITHHPLSSTSTPFHEFPSTIISTHQVSSISTATHEFSSTFTVSHQVSSTLPPEKKELNEKIITHELTQPNLAGQKLDTIEKGELGERIELRNKDGSVLPTHPIPYSPSSTRVHLEDEPLPPFSRTGGAINQESINELSLPSISTNDAGLDPSLELRVDLFVYNHELNSTFYDCKDYNVLVKNIFFTPSDVKVVDLHSSSSSTRLNSATNEIINMNKNESRNMILKFADTDDVIKTSELGINVQWEIVKPEGILAAGNSQTKIQESIKSIDRPFVFQVQHVNSIFADFTNSSICSCEVKLIIHSRISGKFSIQLENNPPKDDISVSTGPSHRASGDVLLTGKTTWKIETEALKTETVSYTMAVAWPGVYNAAPNIIVTDDECGIKETYLLHSPLIVAQSVSSMVS